MDMDPLQLIVRLGPVVARYGVVLSEARNVVHDSSPPPRRELQRSFLNQFQVVIDNNQVVLGTAYSVRMFAGLGFCR